MTIRICVVSSSRADYGILKNLILDLNLSNKFDLKVIVTGSHLSHEHGYTIKEIISDGIKVDEKVPTIIKTDTSIDIANIFSNTVSKMVVSISNLKPDLILLLGDRYEILATAISATILKIPIAHIHGGEITEGATDNAMRHCLTKLSHIQFVSNQIYKDRIMQMGEAPSHIHNVGALGVENLKNLKLINFDELQKRLNFKFLKKNILITYHPVTLDKKPTIGIDCILKVLNKFHDIGLIFTLSNADIEGSLINKKILEFTNGKSNAVSFFSLGQIKYFSCLKHCDLVLGNSSSGIIEAPAFNKFTINVGNRQKGRLKSKSVFDVEINERKIEKILNKILNNDLDINENYFLNPYYKTNTKKNILKTLYTTDYSKLVEKTFYDIDYYQNKLKNY